MKQLASIYIPVKDLRSVLAFYRDTLGFEESWREGELTCGLRLPGTDVELMLDQLDQNEAELAAGPSPFFEVEDVREFYGRNRDELEFVGEPQEIPPGYAATFRDPAGHAVRIFDTVKERG